jgi:hypothetical protein
MPNSLLPEWRPDQKSGEPHHHHRSACWLRDKRPLCDVFFSGRARRGHPDDIAGAVETVGHGSRNLAKQGRHRVMQIDGALGCAMPQHCSWQSLWKSGVTHLQIVLHVKRHRTAISSWVQVLCADRRPFPQHGMRQGPAGDTDLTHSVRREGLGVSRPKQNGMQINNALCSPPPQQRVIGASGVRPVAEADLHPLGDIHSVRAGKPRGMKIDYRSGRIIPQQRMGSLRNAVRRKLAADADLVSIRDGPRKTIHITWGMQIDHALRRPAPFQGVIGPSFNAKAVTNLSCPEYV